MTSNIGILNESALHRSLKELQVDSGDEIECVVEGYIVDVKKADRIVEIQTSNLHRVAKKNPRSSAQSLPALSLSHC